MFEGRAPSVAICIPTYNQGEFVLSAVMSAIEQTYEGPLEIWVSDDASTDATPALLAEYMLKAPQVRYYRHENNLGMGKNSNWVVEQPDADFIVKLDSDDVLSSEYVQKLADALQKHPNAGYAHSSAFQIDEAGIVTRVRRLSRPSGYQDSDAALLASLRGYRVSANIIMFRRKALHSLNYYDASLPFAEDWDLSIRMAEAGFGNVYLEEVLCSYRVWTDSGHVRPKRKFDELEAITRILDGALTRAFQKKSWDLRLITKQRKRLALSHSNSLASNTFSPAEKRKLRQALMQLGDSWRLRVKLAAVESRLAPMLELRGKVSLFMRDVIKGWISKARRS